MSHVPDHEASTSWGGREWERRVERNGGGAVGPGLFFAARARGLHGGDLGVGYTDSESGEERRLSGSCLFITAFLKHIR